MVDEKIKVLIVEDDKFLSELISTKLDKEGFDITLANDGESGVQKTTSEKIEDKFSNNMPKGWSAK